MFRPALQPLLVLLIVCATLVVVGPSRAVPLPDEADVSLTWDLTPYEQAAPEIQRAWEALREEATGEEATGEEARDEVIAALEAALSEPASLTWRDPHTVVVARWLRGRLLRLAGEDERAREDEEAVLASGSAVADPLRLERGRALAEVGKPLEAARVLLDVTPASSRHLEACRLAARVLREAGEPRRAAAALESLRARPMDGWSRAEISFLAAEAWEAADDRDAATRLLREVWWESEADELTQRAAKRLDDLDRAVSPVERIGRIVLKAPRWRTRQAREELAGWQPSGKLERRMLRWGRAVLARWDDDDLERSDARLKALAPHLEGTPAEPFLLVGHALVLRHQQRDVEAAAMYQQVADRWPDHVLAVESLVEAGGLMAHEGMPAEADALFRRAVGARRPGDAEREALWEVGFSAWLRGEHADATVHLMRLVERYGGDRDGLGVTWSERGSYWLARALEAQGRLADAVRIYTDLAVRFPLGWYAILATQRRDGLLARPDMPLMAFTHLPHGPRMAANELLPLEPPQPLEALRAVRRPVLDLAVAWLRLGEIPDATDELRSLYAGERLPGSGRAMLATALRLLGDEVEAARVLRRGAVLAEIPHAEDPTYVKTFPFEHGKVMERAARDHDIPAPLLAGLVHVESRYRNRATSGAGAVGLTQLLPATARWVARRVLGKRVGRRALHDPETNLTVGAALLGQLMTHFRDNPAPALAAYNAGRGRARRWLRERGHMDTDAWVETIPFMQTRRYVMRVVSVSEIYRRLHDVSGSPVTVPRELPLALGPFME
ncbi:MAG: transglycosylase SLT domain-containing protein [Myxococcota bacterium]